jgi:glutamate synthase (NADPH/NADH) large chain
MTGGTVVILGKVGDNFGAGMTGGMAFVYDPTDEFEKYVNPESVIWQKIESKYWREYLKDMIVQHHEETNSSLAKRILDNFELEKNNFKQICPIEMLDKLKYPITTKFSVKTAV